MSCNRQAPQDNNFIETNTIAETVSDINESKLNQPLTYLLAIDSFINTFLVEYDTLPFNNFESNVGRKLNYSNYCFVRRQLFKKKISFKDTLGKIYYKRFELIAYEYPDSASCNLAFESWLNNFGTTAFPITRGENLKSIHAPPTFIIYSKTQITALFMPCLYLMDDWEPIKLKMSNLLESTGAKAEFVDIGCGGPLIWRK